MAWRPNENLLDGELSNRIPGKVTGWMRFFRRRMRPLRVAFDLAGDFHEDIRGSDIVLKNDHPSDEDDSPASRSDPGPKNSPNDSRRNLRSSGKITVLRALNWRTAGEMLPRTTPRRSLRANSTIRT